MAPEALNPDTLDFILETTKHGPESQLRDVEGLDAKLIQIFAAASVVIGLAGFKDLGGGRVTTGLLAAGLTTYCCVVLACISGLWARKYRTVFHAQNLWSKYWNKDVEDIKHALVADIAKAYAWNKDRISQKADAIKLSLALTGVEVVLIGAALLASRLA